MPADPTSPPASRARTTLEILAVAALAVAAVWLIFGELGSASFHDGDEALYATVAREMAASGGVATPTYWDLPFLHKPPLPYWLMSLSSATLPGTREFQARAPSALAALALLAATYFAARRLAGFGPALLGAAVLLANHQFLFEHAARSANFDALLAFFMFAALMAGLSAPGRAAGRWIFPVCVGATALVKAPMVIFPLLAVLAHRRVRDGRLAARDLARDACIIGAVALPWHLYQAVAHGREFWNAYFVYEMLGRAGGTLRDPAAHTFIHLEAAWKAFLPWSPLLVVALAGVAAGRPRARADEPDGVARATALYALSILAFFCFIPAKWPWYGIPAYPAAAVALAVFVRRALDSRWRVLVPALFAAQAAAIYFFFRVDPAYSPASRPSYLWPARTPFRAWDPSLHGAAGVFLALLLGLLALIPFVPAMKRRPGATAGAAAAAAALVAAVQLYGLARVPRSYQSPVSRLAAGLEERHVRQVYAVGFFHEARYGGRPEPLSSYYLLGIPNATITDCGESLDCLPAAAAGVPSAIVVRERFLASEERRELPARLAALEDRFEIWVVGTDASGGVTRL